MAQRLFYPTLRNSLRCFGTTPGWQTEAVAVPQAPSAPLILNETSEIDKNVAEVAREAWIETLDPSGENLHVGLIHLHPKVFATYPRLDIIHENVVWQQKYRMVNTSHTKLRSEVRGGGRKPWPQKGTGRARHGSIRSPLWKGGGVVHGPRAFTTQFYMLSFGKRIMGLTSTLSAKFAQDDLKIVENLDMPSDEAGFLEKLCEDRCWGPSVLFVDDCDLMPRNITVATDTINHINLMPVYGLNVYSMLKHNTVVLTVSASQCIEERILHHLNKPDYHLINCAKCYNK
ncbi:large ribosomal subunit protein uL4m [Cherax quadricarinatus]